MLRILYRSVYVKSFLINLAHRDERKRPYRTSKREFDWIPIPALNVYNRNVGGSRTQYPLRLAYALTIHKSQGQTMDKVVIDLGKCEKTLGMSYVALSRVKNFSDFLIEPFPLDRFLKIKQSSALNERTTEENRINTIISQTFNQFDFLKIYYL